MESGQQLCDRFFAEAKAKGYDLASCYAYASGALIAEVDQLRMELAMRGSAVRQQQPVESDHFRDAAEMVAINRE